MTPVHEPLKNYLERMIRHLGQDTTIRLQFAGETYRCERIQEQGKSVFLIHFAELPDILQPDFRQALEGYCDHETAHCLFSDFNTLEQPLAPRLKQIFNLLEDLRVEKLMGRQFAGCAQNIAYLNQYLLQQGWPQLRMAHDWQILLFCLWGLLQHAPLPERYRWYGNFLEQCLSDLLPRAHILKTTRAALMLAREILVRLDQTVESPLSRLGVGDVLSGGTAVLRRLNDADYQVREKVEPHLIRAVLQELTQELGSRTVNSETSPPQYQNKTPQILTGRIAHRPYNRTADLIDRSQKRPPHAFEPEAHTRFLAQRLAARLQVRKRCGKESGLKRGRPSGRDLHRALSDQRVFYRKSQPAHPLSLAICLGVDVSGSMKTEKTLKVLSTVWAFIRELQIPFEVFAYTTRTEKSFEAWAKQPDIRQGNWTRIEPLLISILKDYDQNTRASGAWPEQTGGRTPMADAWEYALNSLKQRRERQKCFVHITDGEPWLAEISPQHLWGSLHTFMAEFHKAGIPYLNIGYEMKKGFQQLDPHMIETQSETFAERLAQTLETLLNPI